MNSIRKADKQIKEITITSLEIASMMGVKHYQILEKLEGTKTVKGIIPILTDHNFVVSEYFIESSYVDASGKNNKMYHCTKMGCDFLANKFTGEKGIIFTAKYVAKFNKMEYLLNRQALANSEAMVHKLEGVVLSIEQRFVRLENEIDYKIEELAQVGIDNHRPSHRTKLDWNRVIKSYAACKGDEELLKQATLDQFNATKWEDIPYDRKSEVLKYIRGLANELKMIVQLDLTTYLG